MGIFDKLFGKKEKPSETIKDCCSQKNDGEIKHDKSTSMDLENKYQNIKDTVDLSELNLSDDMSKIKELDYEKNNIELYFCGINEYKSSFFQCKKTDKNTSTKIISKWSHEIEDDCNFFDSDEIKEKFDNTNDLFEKDYRQITLSKTNSKNFIKNFIDNLNKWSKEDISTVYDIMEKIDYEPLGNDGYDQIEEFSYSLGNDSNLEWIFDEVNIDKKGNLIDWCSHVYLIGGSVQIGFKIK